jgi:hypothetical protein
MAEAVKKLTIFDLQAKAERGEKIFQVTAVDYPTAQLVDRSGVDCILVGDSLGMTALGYTGTVPVTMDEMLHHAKAITRAVKRAIVVGDLPLGAYHASTADAINNAMRMLKEQVKRTPAPQWVRVVGGWSEFQFAERRMPTLDEINAVAPETPVFVLHLYDRAILNAAAVRAVGYTKDSPNPIGGEIQRDRHGNPTGMLIARPNAMILYATLSKGPKLSPADQANSTRHFMREMNRLGVTSVIDAGGGFQNYPDDYAVVNDLARDGLLTLRLAYNLFTQKPKGEKEDFLRWAGSKDVYEKWFKTQKGFSVGATRDWSKHPMWNEDPVMLPFRDVVDSGRAPGWPGPASRKAAEAISKYVITDMYAKAVQGMTAEDAVKWAHAELVKVYGG